MTLSCSSAMPAQRSAAGLGPLPPALPQAHRLCRLAGTIAATLLRVEVEQIVSPRRERAEIALARHVAMYLAHVSFQLSMNEVAACFGRDRTSITYALRRVEDRRDEAGFDLTLSRMELLATSFREAAAPMAAEPEDG